MKTVYVLGAGVDVPLGLPLADDLLEELHRFVANEGSDLDKTLRRKLGRFRFSFSKYAADQGEGFAERILSDGEIAARIEQAFQKVDGETSLEYAAVRTILRKLSRLRCVNELSQETAQAIATLAGEPVEMADHALLNTRGLILNPMPRNALVRMLRKTLESKDLQEEEREALDEVVAMMTKFEELLTELFAGFYSSNLSLQRRYLYVAWLLWGYMRWKSFNAQNNHDQNGSFYSHLRGCTKSVKLRRSR